MSNKVSIGSTTIIGWASGLIAVVPTIIKTIEGDNALTGPQKYLAIGGAIILGITQIGRYAQAHKLIPNSWAEDIDTAIGDVEKIAPEVSETLQSAAKADGPDTPSNAGAVTSTPTA